MYKENDKFCFSNCYCNPLAIINQNKLDKIDFSKPFQTSEELIDFYEFVLAKNYKSGVKDIFIINDFLLDLSSFSNKYNLNIKNIINAENIFKVPSSFLVGKDLIVELKNIEEYSDNFLSEVVSLCAKLDLPILIHFAKDLTSLGKLSSKYNKAPEKVLEDFGFLDRKCYLLGCNYLDKDAIYLFDSYDIEYIFTPLSDAENARGFLNFKLFENKICHIGTDEEKDFDILKQADFLRLTTNNLLCKNDMIEYEKYFKLLSLNEKIILNRNNLKEFLKIKIDLKVDDFQLLSEKVLKSLALK